jgi:hypothetical protein
MSFGSVLNLLYACPVVNADKAYDAQGIIDYDHDHYCLMPYLAEII